MSTTKPPPFPRKDDPDFVEKRRAYMRAYSRKRYSTPEGKADAAARKARYRAKPGTKDKEREYNKKWSKANPDKCRATSFKHHHGVARAEADALIEEQDGLCKVCGQKPKGRGHCGRLHVDHCSETGRIRGMLCSNCNMALGHVKDSVEILAKMIEYLS